MTLDFTVDTTRTMIRHVVAAALVCSTVTIAAQGQGRGGGAAPSPRAAAPVDLTGTWIPLITEDWRWRMRVPPKGDYASVPLNNAGGVKGGRGAGIRRAMPRQGSSAAGTVHRP